ncbi:MAG: methyltransferase [Alphaproteobacteria bacterium]|nr:methyltransferase [Alphaproteobacteria bacterium]
MARDPTADNDELMVDGGDREPLAAIGGIAITGSSQPAGMTCDAFLGGALQVLQPLKGFRAGLDSVLLAASVPQPPPGRALRILDLGAGVGVAGLCAATRLPGVTVTLVERNAELCELACSNIDRNGLAARATVVQHDVSAKGLPEGLDENAFDVTLANPPYYLEGEHRRSPNDLKAASHSMPASGLDGWLRFMARMTCPGGIALVVHRADQIAGLLAAFTPRFGGLVVQPLHPRAGKPANRVIVRGIKASRAPMRLAPGIMLHGEGNHFQPAIDHVLKQPAALDWSGI